MNGRSSTFGGLLGNVLLVGFGIYAVIIVWNEIVGPIICGVTANCGGASW